LASIENRSRFTVTVKHRPDLTRPFPHTEAQAARGYLESLRAQGYKPVLTQAEDNLWIRIRQKGHKPQSIPASSYEEAERIVQRLEAERAVGLFVDYREGHLVSGAQLMQRYLEQEVPKHKGRDVEKYTVRGWIEDSTGELARRLDERQRALDGETPPTIRARREPRRSLEWLQKPFAQILPKDVESYIIDRIDDGLSPSTVDRELDLFAQVCNWAIDVQRIAVHKSPMDGVRRPRYFNERDRRLTEPEKARLLAAARVEDRARSLGLALEPLLREARTEAAALPNATARKRHIAAARAVALEHLGDRFPTVPVYEALITFLLMTAARRGEALRLEWRFLDLRHQTAFFEETKNGRSRTVPVRRDALPLLATLPRTGQRVFPISVDDLKGAWARMCARAKLDDLHIHDLRHSGVTEIVETAFLAGSPLTLPALQAITGHRDLASLARYTHVCAGQLAQVLDRCFAKSGSSGRLHKGRTRAWSPTSASKEDVVAAFDQPSYNKLPA
jgi:integrase